VATSAVHTVALQVHAAEPALPVQLWLKLGHATGVPYAKHPLLPIQVARLPETHEVCPCEQLLVHVVEHAARGDVPEHDSEPGHVDVADTYGQPLPSTMHVASVCPFWQVVPASVQIVATHVHAEALTVPVHVWCVPQVVAVHELPSPPASVGIIASMLAPVSISVASFPASAPLVPLSFTPTCPASANVEASLPTVPASAPPESAVAPALPSTPGKSSMPRSEPQALVPRHDVSAISGASRV
jgi:hypothetical protein